jgi:thiamine biosynthesis lipoprotein
LRDPYEKGKVGDVVRLNGYSLSVSGSYEKFFTLKGRTYSHILDPRSGRPVQGMLVTTVLAPRSVESDALSTTLFVLGVQRGRAFLQTHSNVSVLFYEPTAAPPRFRRVHARSAEFTLPPETIAEFEK